MKTILLIVIIFILLLALLFAPIPNIADVGRVDFTAYWSASYLLAHSQNFSDAAQLLSVEQTLAGWPADFPIFIWNPPWLLTMLLPYTLVSFARARWLWLISNILFIFSGSIMAWLASSATPDVKKFAWIGPIIGFLFAPALTALYMGQVNTLVFFGLALYLFLEKANYQIGSGIGLTLTMVKPHLVYVTIAVLTLRALWRKQWRFLTGFAGTLLFLTLVAFLLRPSFLTEYLDNTVEGQLLNWVTPTLGDFLSYTFGWSWAKLIGILVLPLAIIWWWRVRLTIQTAELVQITLLISITTAPFGWGYDAIVLLIPIIQIVVWVFEKSYSTVVSILFILALIMTDALIFYHRTIIESEVEVFWIPVLIAFLYFLARYKRKQAVPATAVPI